MKVRFRLLSLVFLLAGIALTSAGGGNKYSAELNLNSPSQQEKNLMGLENPFRMQKINILWEKAKKRLTEGKIKTLYGDLKSQDKDEILLKKLKSEGQDKEGIKEAALRKQLKSIMNKYGLTDPWTNPDDNKTSRDDGKYELEQDAIDKMFFKDKKLNKLWLKAEKSGLNDEEMNTLKEEFEHHQEKIEQYYQLMDKANRAKNADEDELINSIDQIIEETGEQIITKSPNQPVHQLLKEKHREIKKGYDQLIKQVSRPGDGSAADKEFEESAVQQLWELAEKTNFSPSELSSLREELHHYEHRMKKLRHFQAELDLEDHKGASNKLYTNDEDADHQKHLKRKVKEIEYKVSKIHNELESRIIARHSEL